MTADPPGSNAGVAGTFGASQASREAGSAAPSPYAGTSPVASLAHTGGVVTLVEGQTFALSGRTGDMAVDLPHGLFLLDTRVLSRFELLVGGQHLEPLTVADGEPFAACFVGRATPRAGHADADLVVFRDRHVSRGMREVIRVTNHGRQPVEVAVELACEVDFADLFAVKESRARRRGEHRVSTAPDRLVFLQHGDGPDRQATVAVSPAAQITGDDGRITWRPTIDPGVTWKACVEVRVAVDGNAIAPRFTCGGDDRRALPVRRLDRWHARFPEVDTDNTDLARTLARSRTDLGALRIFDPEHPDLPILAAGSPWFMTVFGRDSLLTAWMTLLADPSLAHGVLETLARFQGDDVDPATEEEPGRILHEIRFGASGSFSLHSGEIYYGSIDATPLFVMLLGELRRWNPDDRFVERLLGHADRALEWIEAFGDRDGDGYVEYQRASPHGLANQGWKDSWDAVAGADGTLAGTPIALCEVQGYVYAAYVARAHFALEAGDDAAHRHWAGKARALRERFNEDFWLEQHGTYALALDGDKRPVEVVASNVGHCLWTGIVDPDRAAMVADRLLADELFSGFGVRTLSTRASRYNPVSYHNGSIWPHDNAICAAGLARYGFVEAAHRIITAQLDVASAGRGTLPELFAGFDRAQLPVPAAYPTSCSPQAWAAASPLLWLRTLLRLDPWAPHGQVWLHPELPPGIGRLAVSGIRVGGHALTVSVAGDEFEVTGADGLEVVHQPRPPLMAASTP